MNAVVTYGKQRAMHRRYGVRVAKALYWNVARKKVDKAELKRMFAELTKPVARGKRKK